jgi:DNA-binding XRE family transcriptional regulator
MKKSNPRRYHPSQPTHHGHDRARSQQPVRLTQSAKPPNANLPFSEACLAYRQRTAAYAERSRSILPVALRQLREARRLSQYVVALRAGISRDMLWRVETGRSVPTFFLLSKIVFSIELTWSRFSRVVDKMVAG